MCPLNRFKCSVTKAASKYDRIVLVQTFGLLVQYINHLFADADNERQEPDPFLSSNGVLPIGVLLRCTAAVRYYLLLLY